MSKFLGPEEISGHATTARCLFRYLKRFWGTRSYPQNNLVWKGREHSKVVFSIPTPVAPVAHYSLRDGQIIHAVILTKERNEKGKEWNQNGISRNTHEKIWNVCGNALTFAS